MVDECFGASAKSEVDAIRADHLPVILLAYKEKGSVSIKAVIKSEACLSRHVTMQLLSVRMAEWSKALRSGRSLLL